LPVNRALAIQGGTVKVSHSFFSIFILFTVCSHADESKTIELFKSIDSIFIKKLELANNIVFSKEDSPAYISAMNSCFKNQKNYLYNLLSPTIENHLNNKQIDTLVNWFKQDDEKLILRILAGELKQGDVSERQMAKIIPFTQSDAFQSFIPATAALAKNSGEAGETFAKYCKSIANKSLKQDK
jgi:hypothetical protein